MMTFMLYADAMSQDNNFIISVGTYLYFKYDQQVPTTEHLTFYHRDSNIRYSKD